MIIAFWADLFKFIGLNICFLLFQANSDKFEAPSSMIPQSIKSVGYIPWLVLANLSAE